MKSESTNIQPITSIVSKRFWKLTCIKQFLWGKKKHFTKQIMVEHLAYIQLRQKSDSQILDSYQMGVSLLGSHSVSSVQLLSPVQLFVTPWTAAHQASLSIANSQSLLKLMSIESLMPSSHLILFCPLLLLPSIFPSIRVFSNESVLHIRWPKY